MMSEKIALAPCNGMSPNGLVSRVAVGDARKENDDQNDRNDPNKIHKKLLLFYWF